MTTDLIFDIGMHIGTDTEYYLRKGFRVVAVDANPALCHEAELRLREYVAAKQLAIMNCGVANSRGTHRFYINLERSDRSSFIAGWSRSDKKEVIDVECVRLDDLIAEFGIPYYLKADIEGLDHVCVEALERQRAFPQYVSSETGRTSFVQRMFRLGYKRFKVINQIWSQVLTLPKPAREGRYVEQRFTEYHSGPFGNETYGEWLSAEDVLDEISRIRIRDYSGSRHKHYGCPQYIFCNSWYDVHAAL